MIWEKSSIIGSFKLKIIGIRVRNPCVCTLFLVSFLFCCRLLMFSVMDALDELEKKEQQAHKAINSHFSNTITTTTEFPVLHISILQHNSLNSPKLADETMPFLLPFLLCVFRGCLYLSSNIQASQQALPSPFLSLSRSLPSVFQLKQSSLMYLCLPLSLHITLLSYCVWS